MKTNAVHENSCDTAVYFFTDVAMCFIASFAAICVA